MANRPLALIILDGWGYREATDHNAIANAQKPTWDALWQVFPHTLIDASGHAVGLPDKQMGNSEVGHLNMGAGRVVFQDFTRINNAIADKQFFSNPTLKQAVDYALSQKKAIHILGLLSPGGVHSHEHQIHALIEMLSQNQAKQVYIHAFLDGRDTPPCSAEPSLKALMHHCKTMRCGKIASLIGRYYAMDRDKRWERIQHAYDLITGTQADYEATDPLQALQLAYARGETDEFVKATRIQDDTEPAASIKEGDVVFFMNFRADRARELTHALIDTDFKGFTRKRHPQVDLITLTQYDARFKTPIIFPPEPLNDILAQVLSQHGLRQLRIAETEKYAHVTFFFNGGIETPYPGEERILIPSLKISTYDLQPEMSAPDITARLVSEINKKTFDVIICNFANPDMVGHSGNFAATVQAIETIDQSLREIIAALQAVGGEALITSDHGNAELMFDPLTQQAHTAHTQELVPLLYVGRKAHFVKNAGTLCDIAPTMLYLLNLPQPPAMTGTVLLKLEN